MNYKKMLILRALDYADGDADFDGLDFKGENSYEKIKSLLFIVNYEQK